MLDYIVMQIRKINHEKGFFFLPPMKLLSRLARSTAMTSALTQVRVETAV